MLLYHIWLVPTLALALLVPPGATGALVGHINRSGSTLHALQVYRLSELGISTDPSPRSARGLTLVIEDLVNNAADPEHSPQLNSMLRTFYQDRLVESPKSANTITQGEVNQVRDKIRAYWASTDPEGAAEVRISKDSPKSAVEIQAASLAENSMQIGDTPSTKKAVTAELQEWIANHPGTTPNQMIVESFWRKQREELNAQKWIKEMELIHPGFEGYVKKGEASSPRSGRFVVG